MHVSSVREMVARRGECAVLALWMHHAPRRTRVDYPCLRCQITMLPSITSKNGLTLGEAATQAGGAEEYFEVEVRDGQILVALVRIQRADAFRAKHAEPSLTHRSRLGRRCRLGAHCGIAGSRRERRHTTSEAPPSGRTAAHSDFPAKTGRARRTNPRWRHFLAHPHLDHTGHGFWYRSLAGL